MKKIILTITILLFMGCDLFTVTKVLEVKAVDSKYVIVYSENKFMSNKHDMYTIEFSTMFGVNNFLTYVAEVDYSQWGQI